MSNIRILNKLNISLPIIKHKNMKNFNKLYNEYHKYVLNQISFKINDNELAQEITNDIFMRIYNTLDKFDEGKASMKTWITSITRNAIIDFYRKRKIEMLSLNNDDSDYDTLENKIKSDASNPHELLSSKEAINTIEEAMYSLNKNDFEIAYYFFKEELNYDEIAKQLDMPLGSVKGKIHRVRKTLQTKLTLV